MCDRREDGLCRGICPNARALTQKCSRQRIRPELAACCKTLESQPRTGTLVQRQPAGMHKRELAPRLLPSSAAAALLLQA